MVKSEDGVGVPIFQGSLDLLERQGNEFKIGVAPTEPQLEQFHDKPLRLSILKLGKRPRILLRHARGKQRARKEAPDRFRRPPDAHLNHVRSRCRLGSFQTLHHVRVRQNIVGTPMAQAIGKNLGYFHHQHWSGPGSWPEPDFMLRHRAPSLGALS